MSFRETFTHPASTFVVCRTTRPKLLSFVRRVANDNSDQPVRLTVMPKYLMSELKPDEIDTIMPESEAQLPVSESVCLFSCQEPQCGWIISNATMDSFSGAPTARAGGGPFGEQRFERPGGASAVVLAAGLLAKAQDRPAARGGPVGHERTRAPRHIEGACAI